jgi:UDP-glucose 4-epimerase
MKALIFGGAGFVGSHVADALVEAGHKVTIFDRSEPHEKRDDIKYIIGDTLDADAVEQATQNQEVIYNFAGQPDIETGLENPLPTIQTNIIGCANQLESARKAGVKRFVFASTVYVYSEAGGIYRVSKQACELMIEEYQRLYGLDYTIVRYGSLYGRRADDRNSVRRYLTQALSERKLTTTAGEDDQREYIHVSDAARSSVEILADEFCNQHVILTGHQSIKVRDFLEMIREIIGLDIEISYVPVADGDVLGHYARTPYSFRPKVGKKLVSHHYSDLGQGLLDCLDEIYQTQLENADS